jgi:hypothetical protein
MKREIITIERVNLSCLIRACNNSSYFKIDDVKEMEGDYFCRVTILIDGNCSSFHLGLLYQYEVDHSERHIIAG